MTVTVIVALHNRALFVEACLNSLLLQRDACDLDILVIDDGSTDDGPDRVQAMSVTNPEIRLIRQENAGVTAVRNRSRQLLLPETEFVTFLDSDDLMCPNRFSSDLAVFRKRPEIQFTYGMVTMFKAVDPAMSAPMPDTPQVTVRGISLSCALFRRGFFDELGDFDVQLPQSEDFDFLMRAIELGAPYERTPTICYYYRRHPGNMTHNTTEARRCCMLALHKSMRRRRANPELRHVTGFFDLTAIRDSCHGW